MAMLMKNAGASRMMGQKVQARPAVARPTRPASRMACNAFMVTLKTPRYDDG
jgi:hypothetical protein